MKRLIVLTGLLFLGSLCLGGLTLAKPTQPSFGSFVNGSVVPSGSVLVLNVTYKVKNDEDSGNVGYWALASYNKHLQVWQAPDGIFYAVARYNGKWKTFEGALSPGLGVAEARDARGTFHGGYTATFSGTFDPGTWKKRGNIGSFDFGGTKEDVLLGRYGAGQVGPATPFDVLARYFPGYTGFAYVHWGWKYRYRSQTWNNFDYGTTGDIVTK
jgi:hypothetical protein